MSQGLALTKRRMKSVDSTKKITNAMKLVATAKLKKWKNSMADSSLYSDSLMKLVKEVFSSVESIESPYLKENEVDKKLYIVVTSTLGLCGGYNYNIFKAIDSILQENDDIIVIGTKGMYHFKDKNIILDYVDLCDDFEEKSVRQLGERILQDYALGKYKTINLVYTHYLNSLTFVPECLTLLPVSLSESEEFSYSEIIMEPSQKELASSLIPFYCNSILYNKLLESIVSEQASRRTAMENATNNATEIYDELQIEYNKERQAQITQEITEVVGGANK